MERAPKKKVRGRGEKNAKEGRREPAVTEFYPRSSSTFPLFPAHVGISFALSIYKWSGRVVTGATYPV